jgi:hypothetical protein
MKVFISWSGERSRQIACLLHKWLPTIHQGITPPYMSSADIGKGVRWAPNLAAELEGSNFGLVCLTPENLNAPWLHFEAGALSKIAKSRLAPILFKVTPSEIHGPLAQFQAVALNNEEEMRLLFKSINDASNLEARANWEMTFRRLWDQVKADITALPTVTEDKIQITSPKPKEPLSDPQKYGSSSVTCEVRMTLRQKPKDHAIWLLVEDPRKGKVWPQGFFTVQYDPKTNEWFGRVNGSPGRQTKIIAVVAPPTSQDYFKYFQRVGGLRRDIYEPLDRVPSECTNTDAVDTVFPM